jgi:plasmid stabilization system protein ParE
MNLFFLTPAFADVEAAVSWYEQQSAGLGQAFEDALNEKIAQILEAPTFFMEREAGVRWAKLQRFPYQIYYRIESDMIFVMAVLHEKRHPDTWKERQ